MAGILPIDPDKLDKMRERDDQLKLEIEEKERKEATPPSDTEDDKVEETVEPEAEQTEMFEKPKPVPKVEISKRTGKPKRKMNEKQLANLKKAQEASRKKRGAMREAKEMEKTAKRLDLEKRKKEKVDKRLEDEAMIEYRRQVYLEESNKAKHDNTWDEERLTSLMTRTIGNYLDEKKKQKPKPKEFIPIHHQQYQQYPTNAPQNYQQAPQFYQQQQQQQQTQQPQYVQPPRDNRPQYMNKPKATKDTMTNLFGYSGSGY